ncbi:hypothetical protein LEMA_P016440.1 [Plenodomus lingam JN3]|uniref:Reticulon-like protein n=1 Tax=Leptosphaeria maculans (strain JN3 / isolate v23.1.3 / race Av1-4-5-6-7-8) TaxID=985895 RepID=E5AA23_LEPMJ|nr:hypothetical protein LEMA_P016440.1 [Plenodomus lingam JN3]CBY00514.1 hypothetical protein LEMA_P016440.1 [Plenodomus lingam JN3]
MSEAPRVELNSTDLDFDLSASTNQFQQTVNSTPKKMQTNGTSAQNSPSTQNLQNSAIRAKDSILEILSASHAPPGHVHHFFSPNIHAAASQAMSAANNHPAVQSAKETVMNGPVAQSVQAEGAKTRDEFADLANSKQVPDYKAATGQNLTHYHSMFYRLLSWKNPRATAIAFATTVILIFASRYLNLIRYVFKTSYLVLGATATAEVVGQLAIGRGLTSQFRPRQYFTIPKASLERMTDDVEQLINFFVIESQRVVFAENVYVTIAAFFASLTSYFLIKFVPLWGLSLIGTVITFLGPLVYIKNKEFIDAQLEKGLNVANQQAKQVKDLAAQHTENAVKTVQGYTQQATAKAQETVNQYRGTSPTPKIGAKKEDFPAAPTEDLSTASKQDLPDAPKHDPTAETTEEEITPEPAN